MTQLNTGYSFVDSFITEDLPRSFPNRPEETGPFVFCFSAEGAVNVVEVDTNEPDRDKQMDVIATAFIAAGKTFKPAVMVMLGECFVTQQTLQRREPVDCNRFSRDAAYRRGILAERGEVLLASVETVDRTWIVPMADRAGRRIAPAGRTGNSSGQSHGPHDEPAAKDERR